jgi:hypothetical protein
VVQEERAHLFSYRSFSHAAPVPCASLCLGLQEIRHFEQFDSHP